jgi:quercetin dioxygenase-like cupin family protein
MIPIDTPQPVVRAKDEGERHWFAGGGVHIWKVTAEESAGAFFLFEDRMEPTKRTPLHLHPDSDETMIVLSGEILLHLDGTEVRVGSGGVAMAPRGVPHAFRVLDPGGARVLFLHTPGACEAFYRGASDPLGDSEDGHDRRVDMARVQASARENGGIEILGPPPFAPS